MTVGILFNSVIPACCWPESRKTPSITRYGMCWSQVHTPIYASFGVNDNTTEKHINLLKQLPVNTHKTSITLTLLYFFCIVFNPLRQSFFSRRDFHIYCLFPPQLVYLRQLAGK